MTSLAFTGDISFTKYFKDAWKREDLVDDQVLAFLHSANHVIANVECALSDSAVIGTGLKHASDPEAGKFVKECLGADIWTIANNHILDCGQQGLLDTLETARSLGCQTIGAGTNKADAAKPVILEESGGIGIFSTVYTMEKYQTPEEEPGCLLWDDLQRIQETIDAVKAKCRWCVMVVHGGRGEFSQIPLPYVRSKMRSFLKMGVDVIVAHHPHVVQNFERFGKKMIFYSLGNFIFDTDYQRAQKYTDYGMLVKLDFTENKVTFQSMACHIEREKNRIVPGATPAIFTHIGPLQYYLLADLAVEDFIRNDFTSRNQVNPQKYGSYTPEEWNKTYIKRWGEEATQRIHWGRKAYKLGLWKLGKRELVDYIHKGF